METKHNTKVPFIMKGKWPQGWKKIIERKWK